MVSDRITLLVPQVSRSWVYHRAGSRATSHLRVGGLLRFDAEVVRHSHRKSDAYRSATSWRE